jgi:hypothetical protein
VRAAVARECEAVAKAEPGHRQSKIGEAALAIHGLCKGAELEGVDMEEIESAAFDRWCDARAGLGEGDHTAEDPRERWERCREDADPRDLEHVLEVPGFEDVSGAPELEQWRRRRAGVLTLAFSSDAAPFDALLSRVFLARAEHALGNPDLASNLMTEARSATANPGGLGPAVLALIERIENEMQTQR